MRDFAHTLDRAFRDEHGATAIEYALIASIVGLGIIPVLLNTTDGVAALYLRIVHLFDNY